MAAVAVVQIHGDARWELWEWTPLVNGAVGAPLSLSSFNDITLKSSGTYGAGGTVSMRGSLNRPGETSDADTDPLEEEAGTELVLNDASPWGTSRNAPLQIWPVVTNGDGTTSLTVRAVIRR